MTSAHSDSGDDKLVADVVIVGAGLSGIGAPRHMRRRCPYLRITLLKSCQTMGARAQHLLPRQGQCSPWRVHQNYLADVLAIRFGRLEDGVLEFH